MSFTPEEIEKLRKAADDAALAYNNKMNQIRELDARAEPGKWSGGSAADLVIADILYKKYKEEYKKYTDACGSPNASLSEARQTTQNGINSNQPGSPEPGYNNVGQASSTPSPNPVSYANPQTLTHVEDIKKQSDNPILNNLGKAFDGITGLFNSLTGDHKQEVKKAAEPLSIFSSVSGAPAIADNLDKQLRLTASNQTLIYNAASQQLDPTNTNNPNKCSSMSDYIGAMQGKYNSFLSTISSGFTKILGVIGNITSSILGGLGSAISALTNAIATGVNAVIQIAIGGLKLATGLITAALGPVTKLISGITSAIGSVASGISSEASNITSAVGKQFSGPFTSVISSCNPCMKAAQTTETATKPLLVGSDGIVIGPV